MTTDFLICDDFIENVDSGLYELKLFFPDLFLTNSRYNYTMMEYR